MGPPPAPPPPVTDYSTYELTDNCGDGNFCYLYNGFYEEGASGHCCKKPKLSCPIGDPHPNATCGASYGAYGGLMRSDGGDVDAPFCPYETHTCMRTAFGSSFEVSLCCPLPCSTQHILVNGQCYPKREFGDQCDVNEQCKGWSGVCDQGTNLNFPPVGVFKRPISGTCGCQKGYTAQGTGEFRWCDVQCKAGEVKINDKECAPSLKMGDTCEPGGRNLCPAFSYCAERLKKCVCMCGYVKLDEKGCGPEPKCPNQPGNGNSSKPVFCAISGKDSPSSSVVKTCPKGQYCSNYLPEMGLCCPKPGKAHIFLQESLEYIYAFSAKPTCPTGIAPKASCDPRQPPTVCGADGKLFCYQYLYPAGEDSAGGEGICCPTPPLPDA